MAKLEWNRPGHKFFENGIDQAVLFVDGAPGIPWSGLIGLNNRSNGGETQDIYIDGVKANSEAGVEEYLGTLEAYYYPPEFEQCDGLGYDEDILVRIGQQPRKPFHLAYRSWVGDDLNGSQAEYKIHLIYNAYVLPSKRRFQTMSDSAELQIFSWDLTSIPEPVPGFLPTSHLIFESSKLYPKILQDLENIVFGSYFSESRMPMPTEVVNIVGEYLPVELIQSKHSSVRVNLFANASAESIVGFTSGQATVSYIQGVGVHYDVTTTANANIGISSTLTTGQSYRLLIRARANRVLKAKPRIRGTAGPTVFLDENWKWYDYTGISGSGGTGTNGLYLDGSSDHVVGDWIEIDRVLIASSDDIGPWFDESSSPALYLPGLHDHRVLELRDPELEGDLIKIRPGIYRRPTSTRLFETAGNGLFTLQEG